MDFHAWSQAVCYACYELISASSPSVARPSSDPAHFYKGPDLSRVHMVSYPSRHGTSVSLAAVRDENCRTAFSHSAKSAAEKEPLLLFCLCEVQGHGLIPLGSSFALESLSFIRKQERKFSQSLSICSYVTISLEVVRTK